MITLFDVCYAKHFRFLREQKAEKESAIATELGISQQDVSNLLNGRMHYTPELISKLCKYYKITVQEFTKLEFSPGIQTFVRQLHKDAGGQFDEQQLKLKNQALQILHLRKENRILSVENSGLKWELKKNQNAVGIISQKINSKIFVAI